MGIEPRTQPQCRGGHGRPEIIDWIDEELAAKLLGDRSPVRPGRPRKWLPR